MVRILHLDASPRAFPGEGTPYYSVSRLLSQEVVDLLKAGHSGATVTYRNLGHEPVAPVDGRWIAAAFSPSEARTGELSDALALSDALVDEFLDADIYVFGVPMYNFNVPAPFKAYVDQIVRVGRTFAFDERGFRGLVQGKKMIVLTARGGVFQPGTPLASLDFQEPWMRAIFGFIGVTDIAFIHAEGLNGGDREQILDRARGEIRSLLQQFVGAAIG
jgi:FMN-dependent NADH-azoreductase